MRFEVTHIEELDDGSAELHLDFDEEFKAHFCGLFGIDEFDEAVFEAFVLESLRTLLDQS